MAWWRLRVDLRPERFPPRPVLSCLECSCLVRPRPYSEVPDSAFALVALAPLVLFVTLLPESAAAGPCRALALLRFALASRCRWPARSFARFARKGSKSNERSGLARPEIKDSACVRGWLGAPARS